MKLRHGTKRDITNTISIRDLVFLSLASCAGLLVYCCLSFMAFMMHSISSTRTKVYMYGTNPHLAHGLTTQQ